MDSTDAFFLPSRPEGSDSPSNFVFTRSRRRVAQDNEKPAPLEGDVLDLAPTDDAVSRRRRVPNAAGNWALRSSTFDREPPAGNNLSDRAEERSEGKDDV